ERGLHPRQDVVDDAEVDVPGDRAPLRPLEVDLRDAVVLEDGDALLADVDRHEQLALRGGERRAAGRYAATRRGPLRALRLALRLLGLRRFRGLRGLLDFRLGLRLCRLGLLGVLFGGATPA